MLGGGGPPVQQNFLRALKLRFQIFESDFPCSGRQGSRTLVRTQEAAPLVENSRGSEGTARFAEQLLCGHINARYSTRRVLLLMQLAFAIVAIAARHRMFLRRASSPHTTHARATHCCMSSHSLPPRDLKRLFFTRASQTARIQATEQGNSVSYSFSDDFVSEIATHTSWHYLSFFCSRSFTKLHQVFANLHGKALQLRSQHIYFQTLQLGKLAADKLLILV